MAARDNPFYIQPANIYDALMSGVGGYKQAQDSMKQDERDAILKQAGQDIAKNGWSNSVYGQLMGMSGGAGVKPLEAAAALEKARAEGRAVYGNINYGVKPDGSLLIYSHDKQGNFIPINMPQGVSPTMPTRAVDMGTSVGIVPQRAPFGSQLPQQAQTTSGGASPVPPSAQPGSIGPGGYVLQKDIQGAATQKEIGKEFGDRAANLGKAQSAVDTGVNALDRLSYTANRIKNDPALGRITGIPGMFPNIPGGGAANVQAQLETLKSQAAFTVLQAMREASKTGGAVGQVSNFEEQMLMNNLASVEKAQSKEEFQKAMQRIVDYAEGAKGRLTSAFKQDYSSIQKPAQSYPQAPQGIPPTQSSSGLRAPSGLTPQGFANWARANKVPSGAPVTLPDGSQVFAP